ncbi:MAG: sdhC [Betaproteobacteria bacterium]|nr:sdhC [Betaproteobacteria bacterium]
MIAAGLEKNSEPSRSVMANRPKYLNLLQIRMPVPAVVSIMHRVSGAALFLVLPILLAWWQCSLASGDTFESSKAFLSNSLVKIFIIAVVWAYLHHMCAGVRHLASDIDLGTELKSARFSSWLVLAVSIALTILIAVRIW